jgi:magnesium chelatase family protein
MLAITYSVALIGVQAEVITIEVNSGERGELRYVLVGLPDSAVKESQDRVLSALDNCGFQAPNTKTTINLAPGDLKKEGPAYDLPIALCILAATQQIQSPKHDLNQTLKDYLIAGELSLSGAIRPIKGGLAMAQLAKKLKLKGVLLPEATAEEANLIEGIAVHPIQTLSQAVEFLQNPECHPPLPNYSINAHTDSDNPSKLDFSDVKGQHSVRRAVEIAVSGNHNLLIIGSPGSGKSMIAKRIPTIMPQPTLDEYLEILSIHSASGYSQEFNPKHPKRPFRAPHHTTSDVALLGGGSFPKPGEISLAHNGVLFLDELPEFKRSTLEVMRQPLEEGTVSISRSQAKITLPASFMLIAAMNPCPCGYHGDPKRPCRCSLQQIARYRSRISGPLLDRIDLHVEAPSLTIKEIQSTQTSEDSRSIRIRCQKARAQQTQRFAHKAHAYQQCNAHMTSQELKTHCPLNEAQLQLLHDAMHQLKLSVRAYDRILKVARTIADLDDSEHILEKHLLEAIQYRNLDRALF